MNCITIKFFNFLLVIVDSFDYRIQKHLNRSKRHLPQGQERICHCIGYCKGLKHKKYWLANHHFLALRPELIRGNRCLLMCMVHTHLFVGHRSHYSAHSTSGGRTRMNPIVHDRSYWNALLSSLTNARDNGFVICL